MLDVAKITCEQFTGYKITNPQNIAMWLSGYYNGKRGNTILDAQGLNANVKKLEGYCIKISEDSCDAGGGNGAGPKLRGVRGTLLIAHTELP